VYTELAAARAVRKGGQSSAVGTLAIAIATHSSRSTLLAPEDLPGDTRDPLDVLGSQLLVHR